MINNPGIRAGLVRCAPVTPTRENLFSENICYVWCGYVHQINVGTRIRFAQLGLQYQ